MRYKVWIIGNQFKINYMNNQTKDIPVDSPKYRLNLSMKLANSCQGEAFIGRILETNEEVVIKKIPRMRNEINIDREIEAMKNWFLFVKFIATMFIL